MKDLSNQGNLSGFACPIPIERYPHVLLAHGGGGRLMHQLIEKLFLPVFGEPGGKPTHDGAILDIPAAKIAYTTDSYVVRPLFFPGGNIGTLAVNGTVNDLAMCGARPLHLSVGFILEEGLEMETLWHVAQSMRKAADEAGVDIVTGDTKVVDRGKGDGIFINTSGIGIVEHEKQIGPASVVPGDSILVSGDLGRHGMAIMAVREGLEFETTIESDCAPVSGLAMELVEAGIDIHCMRDLTRGGLASVLVEIAEAASVSIRIDERAIRVREDVQGACELLGFDPIYVANEGRFACFVAAEDADRALGVMRSHPLGREASLAGTVEDRGAGLVTMKSLIGTTRVVDMLSGEQLPRIC